MDAKFWNSAWRDGRTGFDQPRFHEKLLEYFPHLGALRGQNVFVPLCGKTKDMVWLHDQGLHVSGVELHGPAVQAFFAENPQYKDRIDIFTGDFFQIEEKYHYDFVYDRAALVALPGPMRTDYAAKIFQILKPHGKCFLISFEHEGESGPPFSVTENTIRELYAKNFYITVLESRKDQSVYVLEKKV